MKKIQGVSYSNDFLETTFSGTIHSVFERTFNIETETNKLMTVATHPIFDGPQMIKINETSMKYLPLEIGMAVSHVGKRLLIADVLEIDCEEAKVMEELPLVFSKEKALEIKRHTTIINNYLEINLDTVGFYRKTFPNDVEEVMHRFLMNGKETLESAFEKDDSSLLEVGVSSLLGLGHGLTPSGDDFLTGFLLVLNSQTDTNREFTGLLNQLVQENCRKTNAVSQNQLKLAIDKRALKPVQQFLYDLYRGSSMLTLNKRVEEILRIGSSSGSDMLAGILSAIRLY
ncbi:DUF2877 domain-containing protein [Vagococcus hydrophili]|uniref:DUF2877 domain-containing protein n=1 Tax=Vagococcus hydrophili TaxID=2714947 RepID=A0A6G8AXB6_9ENTE|nr:DUF2877 domain-containing protein [Vagococcus hydrophili]QIL49657.1 DUF2877 domain-containing protein [Vagococcus hydrophili]